MTAVLRRLFPHFSDLFGASPESQEDSSLQKYDTGISLPENARVMIHGPSKSQNTALLFQCAISSAMDGQVVLYITHEKFSSLPVSIEGATQPDPILMKQVHIKYLSDRPSFLKELSQIHIAGPAPDIIIVDGLDHYISNPKSNSSGQVAASTCAHLLDAAVFLHNKRLKSSPSSPSSLQSCLMTSVSTSSSNTLPPFYEIYSGYFPTTLSITDIEDTRMKQLQCWQKGEGRPQYVVTFEVGKTIRVVDVMVGAELDADWSQASSTVT